MEARKPVLSRLLDGYTGHLRVLGRDLRDYLKLTAPENLRLFARLHGGAPESPKAPLHRGSLYEDADEFVAEFSEAMRGRLMGGYLMNAPGDCREGGCPVARRARRAHARSTAGHAIVDSALPGDRVAVPPSAAATTPAKKTTSAGLATCRQSPPEGP
jgi:hypothetical protein